MSSLHVTTTVLPGSRIEITAPGLKEGEPVDVLLFPRQAAASHSVLEIIDSLEGHRLFQTPEEVDEYLRVERESWDRSLPSD